MKLLLQATLKTAERKTIPPGFMLGAINEGLGNYKILIANQDYFEDYKKMSKELQMEKPKSAGVENKNQSEVLAEGHLVAVELGKRYYCIHTLAQQGYGPTLYDAGMIIATKRGLGLIPAIMGNPYWTTSPWAQKVWQYYYEKRTDVVKIPLPFEDSKRLENLEGKGITKEKTPWLFYSYQLKKHLSSLGPLWPETEL